MEDGLVGILLVAVGAVRLGQHLGQDGAVGDLQGRDGDIAALVVGDAAELEVGVLDAFLIGEVHVLADRAAAGGDDLVVVQDLLALVVEGGTDLLAAGIDQHGGHVEGGLGMEVAGRIRDGEVGGDLVTHQRKDLRIAVDQDVLRQFHLFGTGAAAGGGSDDHGTKADQSENILH